MALQKRRRGPARTASSTFGLDEEVRREPPDRPGLPQLRRAAHPAPRVHELRPVPRRADRREEVRRRVAAAMPPCASSSTRWAVIARPAPRSPVRCARRGDRDRRHAGRRSCAARGRARGRRSASIELVHASRGRHDARPPGAGVSRQARLVDARRGRSGSPTAHGDAVVSAGNSGAMLATSLFVLGRLPGVERPAIVTVLPTPSGPLVLCDAGANVEPKPAQLAQFGVLGAGLRSRGPRSRAPARRPARRTAPSPARARR